ncbi:MAG TPA: hypothetical protein VLE51_02550 [Candidatus Saccharimonadales bacterium]|nr:hypothetical protein [Candidatus Saccharimonadales bacterium]
MIRNKEGFLEIEGNPGFRIQKIAMMGAGVSLSIGITMEGLLVQQYVVDESGVKAAVYGNDSPIERSGSDTEQMAELAKSIRQLRRKGVK